MWFWPLIVIFLFYFFAVLQNSFFAHFNLFGAAPNLVFVFFLLLIFFERQNKNLQIIFYAIVAGLFLDIFSYRYLGVSVVLFIFIGLLTKKIQSLLKEKRDKYPFIYFAFLVFVSLIVYELLLTASLGISFFGRVIYGLLFAAAGFYIYKKIRKNAAQ